jgi:hypothetical protein
VPSEQEITFGVGLVRGAPPVQRRDHRSVCLPPEGVRVELLAPNLEELIPVPPY